MELVKVDPITFDDFWLLYPRHVAKKDARKAWARISPTLYADILTALAAWRRVWAGKDQEFLPYPATWLNGERWEDELPRGVTVSAACHKPAQVSKTERAAMPNEVRALLAKMRAA